MLRKKGGEMTKKATQTYRLTDPSELLITDKKLTREEKLWFCVLITAIDDYTCGIFSDIMVSYHQKEHEEAERYIFGKQEDFNCFNELWLYFFEKIDPGIVKIRLKEIFENKRNKKEIEKTEGEVTDAIIESICGQGRRTATGDNVQHQGSTVVHFEESWAELVLFGTNSDERSLQYD